MKELSKILILVFVFILLSTPIFAYSNNTNNSAWNIPSSNDIIINPYNSPIRLISNFTNYNYYNNICRYYTGE